MKMYVISDNVDTYTGLRLAGIEGIVLHEENEIKKHLEQLKERKDIAILLVTEGLMIKYPHLFKAIRSDNITPLLVEIPDRHGQKRPDNFITEYVNNTIGLSL